VLGRRAFLGVLGALGASCQGRAFDGPAIVRPENLDVVDLSHPLGPSSPYIHVSGATFAFQRSPIATISERGVYANRWELTEHIGTHVDAPCHFSESGPCLDQIPVGDLFANVVIIDLGRRAASNPDAELKLADLAAARDLGQFAPRTAVLLRSGWDQRWGSQTAFGNADAEGVMHFPGFSRAAVELLADSPEVVGIGTDTFSIDPGRDLQFAGHRTLARSGKWALECLANLGRLPLRGAQLFVGAPKVERASGSPARVIAWVPRRTNA